MRLFTRKLWRAFPELDRFSDEQCRRWVVIANRRSSRRLGRGGIYLLAGALVGVAIAWGTDLLTRNSAEKLPWLYDDEGERHRAVPVVLSIVGVLVGVLCALWIRHALYRFALRWALNARGRCIQCRYPLVGLPLDSALALQCPECGAATVADESTGEVDRTSSSGPTFSPKVQFDDPHVLARRQRRRRAAFRIAAAAVATGCVVSATAWGISEYVAFQERGLARSERVGRSVLRSVALNALPHSDLGPSVTVAIAELLKRQAELDAEHLPALTAHWPHDAYRKADFRAFEFDLRPDTYDYEGYVRQRALLPALLQEYRNAGFLKQCDGLSDCRIDLLPDVTNPEDPLNERPLGLRDLSHLHSMLTYRMRAAADQDNPEEFLSAFEAMLVIGRTHNHQCRLLSSMYGLTISAVALSRAAELSRTISDVTLTERLAAVAKRHPPMTLTPLLESERLRILDCVAWLYAEKERIHNLRESLASLQFIYKDTLALPVERYGDCKRRVQDTFDRLNAHALSTSSLKKLELAPSGFVDSYFTSSFRSVSHSYGQVVMQFDAFPLTLEIERFRREKGRLPHSLGELPAAVIHQARDLATTDQPLKYLQVTLDDAPDEPAYILYSIGANGIDDDGWSAGDADDDLIYGKRY